MVKTMRFAISNPERILRLLDEKISQLTELNLYGRAALALGFPPPQTPHFSTKDVDVVIPLNAIEAFVRNEDFWKAQEEVNQQLEAEGLYITHLFSEADVIIRPSWTEDRVPIPLTFQKLKIYRPSSLDLTLTKMMRDDPEDIADIEFIISREPQIAAGVPAAIAQARIPEIPELIEQFERMKPKVLSIAKRFLPATASRRSDIGGDIS
jgi:hypothetical protein